MFLLKVLPVNPNVRVHIFRAFLVGLMLLTVVNEWLIYVVKQTVSWPDTTCDQKFGNNCTKILLVADPQILGEESENFLFRYDSDRNLRNTFSLALDHVQPDGIVFMGDLMDEGTIADDDQFQGYYDRFASIFQLEQLKSKTPVMFIPGDNDIGGENDEPIKSKNVKRFKKYFDSHEFTDMKDIRIISANLLLRTIPAKEDALVTAPHMIGIAMSHIPLTSMMAEFNLPFDHKDTTYTREVLSSLKPEFIFSAHVHISYGLLTLKNDGRLLYYEELVKNEYKNRAPVWTFQMARATDYSVITEIMVPTCSYRMGVFDTGYGVITYGRNADNIMYHMLWLPQRFYAILSYILYFVLCGFFMLANRYIPRTGRMVRYPRVSINQIWCKTKRVY